MHSTLWVMNIHVFWYRQPSLYRHLFFPFLTGWLHDSHCKLITYAFFTMSHEYSYVLIQTTFSLETFVLSSSHWMKNDEGWMMMISSCHPSQEPHLSMFLTYIKSTYFCTNPDEHINLTDFRWNQLQMQQYADNLINFCMLQLILVWTTSHDTSAEKTLPACLFWHTLYVAWKK